MPDAILTVPEAAKLANPLETWWMSTPALPVKAVRSRELIFMGKARYIHFAQTWSKKQDFRYFRDCSRQGQKNSIIYRYFFLYVWVNPLRGLKSAPQGGPHHTGGCNLEGGHVFLKPQGKHTERSALNEGTFKALPRV